MKNSMKYTVDSFFRASERLAVKVGSLTDREIIIREFDEAGYMMKDSTNFSPVCSYSDFNSNPCREDLDERKLCFNNRGLYGENRNMIYYGYKLLTIDDFDFSAPTEITMREVEEMFGFTNIKIIE